MPTRLINLHHPTEEVWEGYAGRRFQRRFDKYVGRSLGTDQLDFRPLEWLDKMLKEGDEDVVVFVSHPERVDPLSLKGMLEERAPGRHRVFCFLQERVDDPNKLAYYRVFDEAWLAISNGMFVASAYHNWILQQKGWPREKLHFVGYPIDLKSHDNESAPRSGNLVYVVNALEGIDFALEVIHYFGIRMEESEINSEITFLLDIPEEPETIRWQVKKDLIAKLANKSVSVTYTHQALVGTERVVFSPIVKASFDVALAHQVLAGAHPVVPSDGCYMEMMQIDKSGERYTYEPDDIESCMEKIRISLVNPSPPLTYIESYGSAFDQMAEIMLT
jgi:hypothetical protein